MDWGENMEDYSTKYLLGQGGFAKVYRAEHRKSGRAVAIKVIDMKRMKELKLEERVINEVEIHFSLEHPSIVKVFKVFEDKPTSSICMVMELCENGELLKHFESSTLTEAEASKYLRQIVDGFLYLQKHGIMHRDLKPANVLLTKDLNAKIADFGLATLVQEANEKHFTMCGTPNYMSPEVASGCAHGLEADVWSIGCMLFTLLLGSPPFDASNPSKILSRVRLEEPVIPEVGLSAEARDLIKRMLRKNPNERIKISEIKRHPFLANRSTDEYKNPARTGYEISVDSGRDTMGVASNVGSHISTDSRTSQNSSDGGGVVRTSAQKAIQQSSEGSGGQGSGQRTGTLSRRTSQPSPVPAQNHRILPMPTVNQQPSGGYSNSSAGGGGSCDVGHQRPAARSANDCYFSSERVRPQSASFNGAPAFMRPSVPPPLPLSCPSRSITPRPYNAKAYSTAAQPDSLRSNDNSPVSISSATSFPTPPMQGGSSNGGGGGSSREDSFTADTRQQLSQMMIRSSQEHHLDTSLDYETVSVSSGRSYKQLGHYPSESNVARLQAQQQQQFGQQMGQQQQLEQRRYQRVEPRLTTPTAFDEQVSRRRSVSMETLSRSEPPEGGTARLVTVDIDIDGASPVGQTERSRNIGRGNGDVLMRHNSQQDVTSSAGSSGITRPMSAIDPDLVHREKAVKVAPFSSIRLRPIRQEAANAVVHILIDGSVCLEFLKVRNGEKWVSEALRISSNGLNIQAYQPGGSKGCLLKLQPPALPAPNTDKSYKQFTYNDMPQKYWNKYGYASRFVNLVRSKTPKVTLYTRRAKCVLMENSPCADFEVYFYDGAKYTQTSTEFKITECDGTTMKLEANSSLHHLSVETQERCKQASDLHDRCISLESLLTASETDTHKGTYESYFPITIGRRPGTQSSVSKTTDRNSSVMDSTVTGMSASVTSSSMVTSPNPRPSTLNIDSYETIRLQGQHKYPNANRVQSSGQSHHHNSMTHNVASKVRPSSAGGVGIGVAGAGSERRASNQTNVRLPATNESTSVAPLFCVSIPSVGYAFQLANNVVRVQYLDGSELNIVQSSPVVHGYHKDIHGKVVEFGKSHSGPLSQSIQEKLLLFPRIARELETHATQQMLKTSPLTR